MLLMIAPEREAIAQSCFATATNVNFGTLSVNAVANATTTGNINEGCTAGYPTNGTLQLCNHIGAGSNSASQTNRTMKSGTNVLAYQLYRDAARTTIFTYPGTSPIAIPYSSSGGGSTNTPVYARITGTSAGLPPGTYTDAYSTRSQTLATFDSLPPRNVCSLSSSWVSAVPTFTVTATLAASCAVTATNMTFPTSGVLNAAKDTSSNLTVTCTSTTPYNVGLSAGTGAGATTALRRMTGSGGATVGYTLYRDASRTQLWGTTIGSDTIAGTGTGSAQALTVYGRVPAQSTPAPGLYQDVINVTVTY